MNEFIKTFGVFNLAKLISIHLILNNFIRTKINLNILKGGSLISF